MTSASDVDSEIFQSIALQIQGEKAWSNAIENNGTHAICTIQVTSDTMLEAARRFLLGEARLNRLRTTPRSDTNPGPEHFWEGGNHLNSSIEDLLNMVDGMNAVPVQFFIHKNSKETVVTAAGKLKDTQEAPPLATDPARFINTEKTGARVSR